MGPNPVLRLLKAGFDKRAGSVQGEEAMTTASATHTRSSLRLAAACSLIIIVVIFILPL